MRSYHQKAFLLLGGNLGEVPETFKRAEELLASHICLKQKSKLYQTQPWGMPEGSPDFVNQVWECTTDLSPHALLHEILRTEEKLGRVRDDDAQGYQNRTLDIDILLFEDLIINDDRLQVPHPRMTKRLFALEPLAEIAPQWQHPLEFKSIQDLYLALRSEVEEISH